MLSESYLYTQEMLEESLDHLTRRGMVVMQFGEKDYANRPNRTARLAATARNAYDEQGIEPFADHIAVMTSQRRRAVPLRRLDDDDEADAVHGRGARPHRGRGRRRCPTLTPATCPGATGDRTARRSTRSSRCPIDAEL